MTTLPMHWMVSPLESCTSAIIDYRGKSPSKATSGVPLITAKIVKGGRILPPEEFVAERDYEAWMRRGLPQVGDVLLTTEAPLGEVAQLKDSRVALAQRLILLRGKDGVLESDYLRYAAQSQYVQDQLRARATGTTVLGIRQSELRRVEIPLPSIDEQRAIVGILGALDDKIELNRSMNETLEAMARAIFKSWFVDFDPVRDKVEGRRPAGMNAETAALFPRSLEDSAIGPVPAGWALSSVGEAATTLLGGTPARDEPAYWDGGTVPWINSGKVNEFRITTPSERITERGVKESVTKLVPARSVVLAITGATLGQVSLLEIESCVNQSVVAVLSSEAAPSEYLYFWIRHRIEDLLGRQTGGAQQHVNKNDVNELVLLVPSQAVMDTYIQRVRPVFDRIRLNCFESGTLTALRDALLPKLLSGEVRAANG